MKTDLSIEERRKIANEILPYLKQNPEHYTLKRVPSMFHAGKSWRAKASLHIKRISISELMELSDGELQELKEKIDKAKAIKAVKTRQQRYFLK